MLDADLVEHACDVVADGLLRHAKRDGDFAVVQALSNRVQHVALPCSKLAERQGVPRRVGFDRLLQKVVDFRDDLGPGRLICQRHVIFAVDLHKAAVGDERCKLPADFDRDNRVTCHVHRQCRTSDLARCLAHAFGAAFDNPELIVACVIGDGEAETGALAASWHSNKFLDPASDGAVLPILHLNGYKIANPTILARIPEEDLLALLRGYGWEPHVVSGGFDSEPADPVHRRLAETLDAVLDAIAESQRRAREGSAGVDVRWPMIVLRTPKGWTGPEQVDGKQVRAAPFEICGPAGCVVRQAMSDDFLAEMRDGTTARVTIVAAPQTEIGVNISLRGFTRAFGDLTP